MAISPQGTLGSYDDLIAPQRLPYLLQEGGQRRAQDAAAACRDQLAQLERPPASAPADLGAEELYGAHPASMTKFRYVAPRLTPEGMEHRAVVL